MWDFLGSLFSSLFGFGSNIFTNMFNKKYQDEANKTNLEIARQTNEANMNMTAATNLANRQLVREQNDAASAEAEKAYQRSKPTTQVGNMQAAGMSLAGAINSLNGGGSYSPAPVNVSTDEASRNQSAQVSPAQLMSSEGVFANIANAFMQREQIKSSERMQRESMQKQAEMQREQIASSERIAQLQASTTNRNADNRLDFDKKVFDEQLPKLRAEINQIVQNTDNLKKIGKGTDLDNIRKDLENKNYPTLAKIANAQAWQSIQYTAMKMAHENANHMNQQERDALELEFYRAVMDSGISLQNAQNELQSYLATQEANLYKDGIVGSFIGALAYAMDKLVPKFASLK